METSISNTFGILALTLILSACGSVQPAKHKTFSKEGSTEESFKQDFLQCRYDVLKHPNQDDERLGIFGQALERNEHNGQMFVMCMQARGYVYQ